MCIRVAPASAFPAAIHEKVRRTAHCWCDPEYSLAFEFYAASLIPPPSNLVPAALVEAYFNAAAPGWAEKRWRAWKNNWGWRAVNHTWGNPDDVWYPANLAWLTNLFAIRAVYPPPTDGRPAGCNLSVGGGFG